MTTRSSSICLLTGDNVTLSLHRAWPAIFSLSFLCSCLKINGCTNFVLLLTFLRHWWRNLSGGKKSHMNELTWNHKTNKWLIILYDQECCQNNLLAISASWWRKTAFCLNPHSVSMKGHQVPLMRKMKNASDFLRSLNSKYNETIFFIFPISCCCDAMQTSVFSMCHFQRKVICQIILV